MAFTTSGQETEWALFLQPRSPHRAQETGNGRCLVVSTVYATFLKGLCRVVVSEPAEVVVKLTLLILLDSVSRNVNKASIVKAKACSATKGLHKN